jgi:hypothetical protein
VGAGGVFCGQPAAPRSSEVLAQSINFAPSLLRSQPRGPGCSPYWTCGSENGYASAGLASSPRPAGCAAEVLESSDDPQVPRQQSALPHFGRLPWPLLYLCPSSHFCQVATSRLSAAFDT